MYAWVCEVTGRSKGPGPATRQAECCLATGAGLDLGTQSCGCLASVELLDLATPNNFVIRNSDPKRNSADLDDRKDDCNTG